MLHIVYNTDDGYLMPTFVSAASAVYHASNPSEIAIDILDCGISESEWERWSRRMKDCLPKLGALRRIRFDAKRISDLPLWKGSFVTYARILTPQLLPDVDWCLFIDGDTLFVSDPLELVQTYDANYWLQGSVDYVADKKREAVYEDHGLVVPDDYVCCGFMLMNLVELRANGFVDKCLTFLKRYGNLTAVDQEAINCVCHGHMARLDKAWGVFNQCAFREVQEPKCIHYVNGKPWLLNFSWTRCIYDMELAWFRHAKKILKLDLSDFPGVSKRAYVERRLNTLLMSGLKMLKGDTAWRKCYFYQGKGRLGGV